MKKYIKYIGLCMCFIITLLVGLYAGTRIEQYNSDKASGSLYNSTKIAVVNLDSGVKYQNKQRNFAKEILSKYPKDYVLTGLRDAQVGIDDGRYAAYVVLPSDFSKNVVTINATPMKSTLKYEISGDLSQTANDRAWQNVMLIKDKLNEDVSYVYVGAVLNEFHDGQQNAQKVLFNDVTDKQVLAGISNIDLITTLKLTKVERVPNDEKPIDITADIAQNKEIMNAVDTTYKGYLGETANELAGIKTDNGLLNTNLNNQVFNSFQGIPRLQKDGLSIFHYEANTAPYITGYNKTLIDTKDDIVSKLKGEVEKDSQLRARTHDMVNISLDDFTKTYRKTYGDNINDYKGNVNTDIRKAFSINSYDGNVHIADNQFTQIKTYIDNQNTMLANQKSTIATQLQQIQEQTNKIKKQEEMITDKDKNIQDLTSFITGIQGKLTDVLKKYSDTAIQNKDNMQKYNISQYLNGVLYNAIHNDKNPIAYHNGDEYIEQIVKDLDTSPAHDKIQKYLKQYATLIGKTGKDIDTYGIKDFIKDAGTYTDTVNDGTADEPTTVPTLPIEDVSSYLKPVTVPKPTPPVVPNISPKPKTASKINTTPPAVNDAINADVKKLYDGLMQNLAIINANDPQDPYGNKIVNDKLKILNGNMDKIEGKTDTAKTTEAIKKISEINGKQLQDNIEQDIKPTLDTQTHAFNATSSILDNQIINSNNFLNQLTVYDPLSKIKPYVIQGYVNKFMNGNAEMQAAIMKQDNSYMSFVNKSYDDADKHIQVLQDDVVKYQDLSDKQVTKGLENAKSVKNSTSANNASLMDSYISKLPYTKKGTVANNKVNDFITAPTLMEGTKASTTNQMQRNDLTIILLSIASACIVIWLALFIIYRVKLHKNNT